jgi:hypothetical protein
VKQFHVQFFIVKACRDWVKLRGAVQSVYFLALSALLGSIACLPGQQFETE